MLRVSPVLLLFDAPRSLFRSLTLVVANRPDMITQSQEAPNPICLMALFWHYLDALRSEIITLVI